MSSIEKLLIRGIRSFSPDSQNVIEFYNPVTIIVGHNGAGKTTIIECLKYATTGDLPPNAKGGAFVHDPKLSADSEVKAQIRLKFKNCRSQTMVVTRSMQSTQKKNSKLEQKSLEGLLVTTDPNTGEQVSVSTRCAELDAEIPHHLGVSRAVLENVIFCHQEDSFWPLSEPSILKKKFDDIFAATRYTKALDALKTLRKELANDLKLESQNLEFLRHQQEKSRRVEADLTSCEGKISESKDRISSLDLQIESVSAGIDRSEADLQALMSLVGEVERLEHDLSSTQQARADLQSSLQTLLTASDEELNSQLSDLLSSVQGAAQSAAEFESQRNQLLSQIEQLTRDYSQLCTERGGLQAQQEALKTRDAERQRILTQLAEMFELTAQHSLTETGALMIAVAERLQSQRERIVSLKSELSTEEQAHQAQLQSAASKHAVLEETRRSRLKQIDDCQEALLKLEEKLADISSTSDDFGDEEAAIKTEEIEISALKATQSARKSERQLEEQQRIYRQHETEQDRLQHQLTIASQTSQIRAKLSLKRAEWERKQEALNKSFDEFRTQLTENEVGVLNSWFDAERDFDSKAKDRTARLKAAQEKLDSANQSLAVSFSGLQSLNAQLERKEAHLQTLQAKLTGYSDAEIRRLEAEIASLRDQESLIQGTAAAYASFQSKLQENPLGCPLCESELVDGKLESLREHIHGQANATERRAKLQQDRQNLQNRLQTLVEVRPLAAEAENLRSVELPELRAQRGRLEDEEAAAKSNTEESQLQFNALSVEERRAGLTRRKIDEGLRQARELAVLQDEKNVLESQCTGGTELEPEALQAALNDCRVHAKEALTAMESLSAQIRARDTHLARREGLLHDRREALMRRQLARTELARLSSDRVDCTAQLERLRTELTKISADLEASSTSFAQLRASRDSWYKHSQERLEAAQVALEAATQSFNQLDSLQAEIERTESAMPRGALANLDTRIKECEVAIADRQEALQSLQNSAALRNKEAAEIQIKERCLRDNLRVRELNSRLEGLEGQLNARRCRLEGIDRASLNASHARAQMRRSELIGERAGLVGELRQLEDLAGKLRAELGGEYAQVNARWQNQLVRVKALQVGSDDLEKYARALDSAIMKYHAVKMDEINAIIRELWTSVYQGTDIDTIEIRADHESTTGTASNGRSYNYRVIMRKGGVELDMRGRSSAGQRVLTCLIIRLALAEVFGLHCGILALDEPTTNLDRDNIAALAGALASIIRTRRTQSNFQLILITHDEEFVQVLGRYECAEYYWRVFKDESQHSCIERQLISGIMG